MTLSCPSTVPKYNLFRWYLKQVGIVSVPIEQLLKYLHRLKPESTLLYSDGAMAWPSPPAPVKPQKFLQHNNVHLSSQLTSSWRDKDFTWMRFGFSFSLWGAVSRYPGGLKTRRSWPEGTLWRSWRRCGRGFWLRCSPDPGWVTHWECHRGQQPFWRANTLMWELMCRDELNMCRKILGSSYQLSLLSSNVFLRVCVFFCVQRKTYTLPTTLVWTTLHYRPHGTRYTQLHATPLLTQLYSLPDWRLRGSQAGGRQLFCNNLFCKNLFCKQIHYWDWVR